MRENVRNKLSQLMRGSLKSPKLFLKKERERLGLQMCQDVQTFLQYELASGKSASLTKESNMHTYFSLNTAKINLLIC